VFTGIVRDVGEVRRQEGGRLVVRTAIGAEPGASVAVNGACLTVLDERAGAGELAFDVVPETLSRTNLGALRPGDRVNLEPALTLAQPLDGHLVQGHVDATGEVADVRDAGAGRELTIRLPGALAPYVAEKGSIAVDGTSVTVTSCGAGFFGVALIPYTLAHTIAAGYVRGTAVNLEVDVLARYAERLLSGIRTQ
jgi:riboflavin synthase